MYVSYVMMKLHAVIPSALVGRRFSFSRFSGSVSASRACSLTGQPKSYVWWRSRQCVGTSHRPHPKDWQIFFGCWNSKSYFVHHSPYWFEGNRCCKSRRASYRLQPNALQPRYLCTLKSEAEISQEVAKILIRVLPPKSPNLAHSADQTLPLL
jgi:hypothetical protein